MITTINEFKEHNYILEIKKYLCNVDDNIDDISLNNEWEEFIDNQELGDCQYIAKSLLKLDIPNLKHHFGHITINQPLDEDDFDKQMTHHWVTINGEIFEFSKGTLKDYVDFNDLYSVYDEGEIEYIEL